MSIYLPLLKNRPLALLSHKPTLLNLFSFQCSFRSQTISSNLNKWRLTSQNYLWTPYFTHFDHFYKTFYSIKQLNSKKRRPLAKTARGDKYWNEGYAPFPTFRQKRLKILFGGVLRGILLTPSIGWEGDLSLFYWLSFWQAVFLFYVMSNEVRHLLLFLFGWSSRRVSSPPRIKNPLKSRAPIQTWW